MRENIKDARLNLTEKFYYLVETLYRRANDHRTNVSGSHTTKATKAAERSSRSFSPRKVLSTRA